jgi:FAD/FMN-containing dehydrogenase
MERRRFLELSLGTLVLTGCGNGGSGSTVNSNSSAISSAASSSSSSVSATSLEWQALAKKLTGTLILPTDKNYNNARVVYNSRFDHIKPQAIVQCATAEDVIAALTSAKTLNIPVVPRGGSHGYAGYSTTTGMVIDVSPMNSISLGVGTATIGAGARLVDVYDQLTVQGVAIPAGSCESVGIAGLTMGGGIGIVDRAYGLTCDNLLTADVVLADGTFVTCSSTHEADLFWALRGGGGGNFGIVTSFTFKTHTTSDITLLEAYFPFNDFEKVMAAWQAWLYGGK